MTTKTLKPTITDTAVSAPLRPKALLALHLADRGLVVTQVVTRKDGAPLTPTDRREARAALVVFADVDRQAYKVWIEVEAAKDKTRKPPKAKPTSKGIAKPVTKRKAAKRPTR